MFITFLTLTYTLTFAFILILKISTAFPFVFLKLANMHNLSTCISTLYHAKPLVREAWRDSAGSLQRGGLVLEPASL